MRQNNTTKRETAQVYRDDGQMIGGIVGDVFRKRVDPSKHFLRRPPAIAFDRDILKRASAEGAQIAEVIDRESGKAYRAPIDRIFEKGFAVNRGHGEQIALPLSQWNEVGDHELTVMHQTNPTQPTLFNLSLKGNDVMLMTNQPRPSPKPSKTNEGNIWHDCERCQLAT